MFIPLLDRGDVGDYFGVVVSQATGEDMVLATVVRSDHHAKVAMKEIIQGGQVTNATTYVVLYRSRITHEEVSSGRRHQLHQSHCALIRNHPLIPARFLVPD